MHIRFLLSAFALALPALALAQEAGEDSPAPVEQSPFVGRYNGSSFETAMGMAIEADGTFRWGLAVGGLDLRAQGTWFEEDETIIFVSDPKPVPPAFTRGEVERSEGGPFLKVVWAGTDNPFRQASVRGLCANGETVSGYTDEGHWSPGEECDRLETLQFRMQSYDVRSQMFDMSDNGDLAKNATIRFEFHRNDLGVANFDGVIGRFEDGKLRVEGPLGAMTLRKLPPASE